MKKLFTVCSLVVVLFVVMAVQAEATPMILGAISFSGTHVPDNTDLNIATEFKAFSNVVASATGGTGDYSIIPGGVSAEFTPFTFRTKLIPNPLEPLRELKYDGWTYGFNATTLDKIASGTNTITMYGTGMAYITGFEDTPSNWYFSANTAGGTASFSASADNTAPVPEPATMLLHGSGLIGLAGIARKKCKKA